MSTDRSYQDHKTGRHALLATVLLTPRPSGSAGHLRAGRASRWSSRATWTSTRSIPHRAFCDTCQIYNSTVYETLLTLDKDNKLIPLLAASWEAMPDQTKFTFKLDPTAKFSDGSSGRGQGREMVVGAAEEPQGQRGLPGGQRSARSTRRTRTPSSSSVAAPNSEFLNIVAAPYTAVVNSKVASPMAPWPMPTPSTKDNAEAWFLQQLRRQRSVRAHILRAQHRAASEAQ